VFELLAECGVTELERSQMLGRKAYDVDEILCGTVWITAEIACDLESVLGTPAHVWLNLQRDFTLKLAKSN